MLMFALLSMSPMKAQENEVVIQKGYNMTPMYILFGIIILYMLVFYFTKPKSEPETKEYRIIEADSDDD